MVFLGTITEALATQDGRIIRARMRIDRAYKGVSEESVVLFDNGMCDGPNLEVGEQYLMYAQAFGNGEVPSRGCTRSRHVKYAAEDFKYLNGLAKAVPTATVFGKVVERTDDYYGNDRPVPDALVEVNGPTGRYTTSTDFDGQYSLGGLEPAAYFVTASQPGYRMLSFDYSGRQSATTVEARGCRVVNMILRKNWKSSIAGRVFRSNGEPAPPGLPLTLIRVENRDGEQRGNALLHDRMETDEKGEYLFSEVAPGRYKVVLNLYRWPTKSAPYPTIYWPVARSEAAAVVIEVLDAPMEHRYDFRLPPEPNSKTVTGIVLAPDGKPAAGTRVFIEALPDNDIGGDDESHPATDAEGNFSFTALEGFEYRLTATDDKDFWTRSAAVTFSLKNGPDFITLTLDKVVPPAGIRKRPDRQ